MKIAHCCLSCFYIDNFTYQENMLVREHVNLGHDVLVVASTETFGENNNLINTKPKQYFGSDGAQVIRLSYKKILPNSIMKKLRIHTNVYKILEDFNPDIIMFHGLCGWELLTVSKFVKNNPNVKLYVDSHEDFNNSATNFISYFILHKFYYNLIIKYSKKFISKILYITSESKEFCKKMYNLLDEELEFYPLGGKLLSEKDYLFKRESCRIKFEFKNNDIVFLQTGKFDHSKKLIESIRAFKKTKRDDFKYIVAGKMSEEMFKEFNELIKSDSRIKYIGWVDSKKLEELLCLADVYVQPGSQSATMQMSMCSRCAVILHDFPSHRHIFRDNGWLVKTDDDLVKVFVSIENNTNQLNDMSIRSYEFAKEHLDYTKLANRILL